MREIKCWICGSEIPTSSRSSPSHAFYLKVSLVVVNRPFATNFESGPVYVCPDCALSKVGMSATGENLNKREGG